MKKILAILFLLVSVAYAQGIDYAKDGVPPLQPVVNYNKVTQAEQTILGRTYENQHIGVRLNRLERSVFNKTYPRMTYEQRMNNIIVNYRNNNSGANLNGLGSLERKVFNRSYDGDDTENRLARLEEEVMGTIQSGDLNSRYNTLSKAIKQTSGRSYTTTRYLPYSTPIMRTGGGWRGLAGSLGNFFMPQYGGYPTGLSPQIYSPYVNNYGPDFQRGTYSNRGWNYHNTNYGSGSGVRILD